MSVRRACEGRAREELLRRATRLEKGFFMPGIDSLKNLQHEGLASINVTKYNELCAGAEDGSDESSASNIDDEDRNVLERDVQDILIQL
jgi:hypothetical protein